MLRYIILININIILQRKIHVIQIRVCSMESVLLMTLLIHSPMPVNAKREGMEKNVK